MHESTVKQELRVLMNKCFCTDLAEELTGGIIKMSEEEALRALNALLKLQTPLQHLTAQVNEIPCTKQATLRYSESRIRLAHAVAKFFNSIEQFTTSDSPQQI